MVVLALFARAAALPEITKNLRRIARDTPRNTRPETNAAYLREDCRCDRRCLLGYAPRTESPIMETFDEAKCRSKSHLLRRRLCSDVVAFSLLFPTHFSPQFSHERFGIPQVRRVKAFCELVTDRLQQL
jgi:hypothetical protein